MLHSIIDIAPHNTNILAGI